MFINIYDSFNRKKIILNINDISYIEGYDPYNIECLKIYTRSIEENGLHMKAKYFEICNKEDIKAVISATLEMK